VGVSFQTYSAQDPNNQEGKLTKGNPFHSKGTGVVIPVGNFETRLGLVAKKAGREGGANLVTVEVGMEGQQLEGYNKSPRGPTF